LLQGRARIGGSVPRRQGCGQLGEEDRDAAADPLEDGAKALVIGQVQDAALAEALEGAITKTPAKAAIVVAVVEDEKGLAKTLRACPSGAPIWIVHRKGKDAAFGENAVRAAMRAKGFIDIKVSAVSADFSATRYTQRPALRR
jgi:hypothetical protein